MKPISTAMRGDVYGRLTVIRELPRVGIKRLVECRCTCGNTIDVKVSDLRTGDTKSCGCLFKEQLIQRNTKHEDCFSAEYCTWSQMIQRCTNLNNQDYACYGGRGVSVYKEWLESYSTFLADVGRKPSSKHTLDRIDNEKGYVPGNVRWATRKEQSRNKRNTAYAIYNGKRRKVIEVCEELGIKYHTVMARRWKGLSDCEIFQ